MRRLLLLLIVFVGAAACGGEKPIPATDLMVRVTLGAKTIAPGRGFPVTVVRVWAKNLDPSPWDEASLAPLVLREATTIRREDGVRIEETRRYRAFAFTLKDITIPPVAFVGVPSDGRPRIATSDGLALRVRPTLDPADPGPPEGPGARPRAPSARWPWLAALALALLAGLAWRRRSGASPRSAPEGAPEERARAALAQIRGAAAPDAEARVRDAVAVARVIRELVGGWLGVRAEARTREELLRAQVEARRPAGPLDRVLAPCDRVKFGAQAPTATERAALLAAAEAFVDAGAGGAP